MVFWFSIHSAKKSAEPPDPPDFSHKPRSESYPPTTSAASFASVIITADFSPVAVFTKK